MKTLQELYNEILASDDLKQAFIEATKLGKVQEFLKAHGCDVTAEDLKSFLAQQTGELSDDELDNAAGGGISLTKGLEAALSTFSSGIGCTDSEVYSTLNGNSHSGQNSANGGSNCNPFM